MPTARSECQAGLVTYPDGTTGILVAGGYEQSSSEFLNLQTLIWEPKPSLPIEIYWGASVQYQESLMIAGGDSPTSTDDLNTFYFFNPKSDDWELLDQRMDYGRRILTAFWVPDKFAKCI